MTSAVSRAALLSLSVACGAPPVAHPIAPPTAQPVEQPIAQPVEQPAPPVAPPVEQPATPAPPAAPKSYCVGRFNYQLPADLDSNGGEQSIHDIHLSVAAWQSAAGAPEAWRRALAEAIPHPSDPSITILPPRELAWPGVGPVAWIQRDPNPLKIAALLAMKPLPAAKSSLFFHAEASVGREPIAQKIVTRIAASYKLGSPQGFCLGPGAFVIAPSDNESASTYITGPDDIQLIIETETTYDHEDYDSTDTSDEAGIHVTSKRRRVGSFDGMEERTRIAESGEPPQLVYNWLFVGELESSVRPRIRLTASAPESHAAALDAAWNMLLGSWHPRATGVR
jgi:hypothetical protein